MTEDWRHLATVGSLLVAVLGTLVLGAVLRVEADPLAQVRAAEGPDTEVAPVTLMTEALDEMPRPVDTPTLAAPRSHAQAQAPTGGLDEVERPLDDTRRILASGSSWTLQFMVTCKSESAARVVEQLPGDDRLFLLPVELNGQACFRICWGDYTSRERAVGNRDLPGPLIELNPEPIPRRVADLIP